MGNLLSDCDFQLPQTSYTNPYRMRMVNRYYDDGFTQKTPAATTMKFFKSPGGNRRRLSSLTESDYENQWNILDE